MPENSPPPVCHGIVVWPMWRSEQSVGAVSNCTHEGGHLTSHLASARAKQVVHESLSHTAKRISCTMDDSRCYVQHDSTEPDTFPYNLAFLTPLFTFVSVDHAFVLMRSDGPLFMFASSLYFSCRRYDASDMFTDSPAMDRKQGILQHDMMIDSPAKDRKTREPANPVKRQGHAVVINAEVGAVKCVLVLGNRGVACQRIVGGCHECAGV